MLERKLKISLAYQKCIVSMHPLISQSYHFPFFLVIRAYNLGSLIRAELTSRGVLYFVGCFYPIMAIWLQKMFYNARFFIPDDAFHRYYEFAGLVVLATAVLHIRPVSILENSADNVDMFTYALSIALANVLTMGRALEVMLTVKGEPAAKAAARRDLLWFFPMLFFYVAAAIVSGLEFYGKDSGNHSDGDGYSSYESDYNSTEYNSTEYGDDSHRSMAAAETATTDYHAEANDLPIWLILAGGMTNIAGMALMVLWLPDGGKHKEYVRKISPASCLLRVLISQAFPFHDHIGSQCQ
jgi:hypothetical protein